MTRIPVLFCTDGVFPQAVGGMQRHSRLLVEALAKTGAVDLTVVHPHPSDAVFNGIDHVHEVSLKPVKSSGKYLIDCYHYSMQVAEVAQANPGSIIYSQGLSAWAKLGRYGNRVIVNPHGLEPYQGLTLTDNLKGIPFRLIFNHIFKRAARVVSLGGRLTGILQSRAGQSKVVVLPNAANIPSKPARQYGNRPVHALFVGRFAFNKGINVLIEAAEQLNAEGHQSDFTFHLVGKGPLWDHYSTQKKLPNVHYLGFADDAALNELYRTCDVFVLPTLFEGMPTVVLEAMGHGMPIIVTDVGATLEMVGPDNGYIIEKNNPASLKKALLDFLNKSESERRLLSDQSYQKVNERFTWDRVAQQHLQVFRELYATLNPG